MTGPTLVCSTATKLNISHSNVVNKHSCTFTDRALVVMDTNNIFADVQFMCDENEMDEMTNAVLFDSSSSEEEEEAAQRSRFGRAPNKDRDCRSILMGGSLCTTRLTSRGDSGVRDLFSIEFMTD